MPKSGCFLPFHFLQAAREENGCLIRFFYRKVPCFFHGRFQEKLRKSIHIRGNLLYNGDAERMKSIKLLKEAELA